MVGGYTENLKNNQTVKIGVWVLPQVWGQYGTTKPLGRLDKGLEAISSYVILVIHSIA